MPQQRKHNSHADRQAAYLLRRKRAQEEQLAAKGLPPLPPVPTMPGWARWRQCLAHTQSQMSLIEREMESYYDQRSERWQDSERGADFLQKLEDLQNALELITEWIT